MRASILLVLLATACVAPRADRAEPPPPADSAPDALAACAGRWFRRGPPNILGRSVEEVLEIARGADGWTLRKTLVLNPGVHPKNKDQVRSRHIGEASPLALEGDRLVHEMVLYTDGIPREVGQTFRFEAGRFFFPAWVRHGSNEFRFADLREDIVIRTEHDPSVVATGTASVTGLPVHSTPITYSASTESDPSHADVEQFTVRFTQSGSNGTVEEVGKLVDHPRWGRALFRFNTHVEAEWTRLDDAEWARIEALPEWDGKAGR